VVAVTATTAESHKARRPAMTVTLWIELAIVVLRIISAGMTR